MSMRFVSPHAKHKRRVIATEFEPSPLGRLEEVRPDRASTPYPHGYIAEFSAGDVTEYEKAEAYRLFGKTLSKGSRVEMDGITPVSNDDRLSVFDTAWIENEKLRAEVERRLLADPEHGRVFVHVPQPVLKPPWPRYDDIVVVGRRTIELVAEQIAEKVIDDGYDLAEVLNYERLKLNRPEVVEALEGLLEEKGERVIEVSA